MWKCGSEMWLPSHLCEIANIAISSPSTRLSLGEPRAPVTYTGRPFVIVPGSSLAFPSVLHPAYLYVSTENERPSQPPTCSATIRLHSSVLLPCRFGREKSRSLTIETRTAISRRSKAMRAPDGTLAECAELRRAFQSPTAREQRIVGLYQGCRCCFQSSPLKRIVCHIT